jgi:hypothetical protein
MRIDWTVQLVDQLEWHWQGHLRPKLEGLTDEEYFWEPAPGAWNVRPRGTSSAPVQAGSGEFTIDFAFPEPDPAAGHHYRVAARAHHRRQGGRGERTEIWTDRCGRWCSSVQPADGHDLDGGHDGRGRTPHRIRRRLEFMVTSTDGSYDFHVTTELARG